MSKKSYPFVPAKISEVKEGEYFKIPLSNGSYACGRLLILEKTNGRKNQRILVGLHDWSGKREPTETDIHNCPLIEQGVIHIKSIEYVNGEVLGYKNFEEDNLKPLKQIEAGRIINGYEYAGKATENEYKTLTRRTTYGIDFIRLLAEKHFVKYSEQEH